MRNRISTRLQQSMKKAFLACGATFLGLAGQSMSGQIAAPTTNRASAAEQQALIKQYCVVCHNDKTKTANFSLQALDPAAAGDHPEVWEKVVRKMRAGMMPPPGLPRPPLAKYEGLRD